MQDPEHNVWRLAAGAWMYIPRSRPATDTAPGTETGFVAAQQRASNCAIEVDAPWASLRCLTPDATQLADADWQPQAPPGLAGVITPAAWLPLDVDGLSMPG